MAVPFDRIRKLGEGAFGEVWLVNRGGSLAAVKYLRLTTEDHVRRFAREAETLWRLIDNRYVVDFIDADLNAAQPYFVMEYCEGGSLADRLQRGPIGWADAATILVQAIMGIEGIHGLGGFHRDLKPANMLFARLPDNKWQIKVSDFGLARVPLPARSMTVSAAGTPEYMAPEIAAGGPFHKSADVYSLGIVGIEMLTGARSIEQLSGAAAPDRMKDLLRRMATRFPGSRPTVQQVAAELKELVTARSKAIASQAAAAAPPEKSSKGGLLGLIAGGAALLWGINALASGDKDKWDSSVGRYRGPDGRFRSR